LSSLLQSASDIFLQGMANWLKCTWKIEMTHVRATLSSSQVKKYRLHPLPIRVMHWLNAAAMIIMIGSGWKIYNDEVLFGWLHFPDSVSLGIWAQHALQWHFMGMWLLGLNGLAYLIYGLATGRFRRMLLPISPREVIVELLDALRFRLKHNDLTRYNAVQRLLYVGIIVVAIVQILSGLAIWKPVQFQELMWFFYDFQGARLAHFIGMVAIVLFMVVHVALALLVPRTLVSMVSGGPMVDPAQPSHSDR
jgi:thiosulfate reductase cytochrome b subunit